tara:strand:- start:264 stop:815 length:552 start_codon:yes stop_codon:yes gene_type:complete
MNGFMDFIVKSWNYVQTELASAIIILLVGFVISYLLGRIIRVILKEIELDNITYNLFATKLKLEKRVSKLATYIFYLITVIVALTQLGIGNYILYLITGVVGLILLISFLLTLYDFIPNFYSYIIIKKKSKIKKNKYYSFKSIKGKVKTISLINTIVETSDNNKIFIPNKTIRKNLKNIVVKD